MRSGALLGFAGVVRELGGDPAAIVRRAGLPLEALTSTDLVLPLGAVATCLELAASELSCPDLGLRLGEVQDLERLGPVAVAIRHAPDIGDALDAARRFMTLHNQGSTFTLEPDPYEVRGLVGMRFVWLYEGRAYPQAMDKILLNVHRGLQQLAGGDYGLRSVELAYPPPAPAERYREVFGDVRVNLGRPITMLRLPSSVLRRPVVGADAAFREIALEHLERQATPSAPATSARVRSALDALLGTGRISTTWVATALETTPRTMQRRLAAEGASFGGLLDAVRRDQADAWLGETELSLGEVATMLDLSDPATLSRAARRWWGVTPSQRRRDLATRGLTRT